MRFTTFFLAAVVCLAADPAHIPSDKRIAYWKLRAAIAEQNAAFAESLTADQKRTLEILRAKSSELKALEDDIAKACGTVAPDASGEPVCTQSPK